MFSKDVNNSYDNIKTLSLWSKWLDNILGVLAQLGARFNGIEEVMGSNPICSIK